MRNNRMVVLVATVAALVLAGRALVGAQPFDGPPPMTDEDRGPGGDEDRLMGEFKRHPKLRKRLMKLRKQRPKEFRRRVRGMRPMLRNPKLREMMIQNLKLEDEGRELVEAYKKEEDGKKKAELKAKLKGVIEKQFDAKMKAHEERLLHMESEIVKLKERIGKRRKHRKEIIEKRLGDLTGDEEGWNW